MTSRSLKTLNELANQLEAEIERLRTIERIVRSNPQLLEQLPELKNLIRPVAGR